MSLPETGYGFTVSAKLFGISVNRIVSNSYNCHKIFVRGHSQMEKPCKIIIIILILSPENRYMTHTHSADFNYPDPGEVFSFWVKLCNYCNVVVRRMIILNRVRLIVSGQAISNSVAGSLDVLDIIVELTIIFHPLHLTTGQSSLSFKELYVMNNFYLLFIT